MGRYSRYSGRPNRPARTVTHLLMGDYCSNSYSSVFFLGGGGPLGGGDFLEAESKQGSKWQTMAVSCARRPTVDERSETE